MRHPYKQIFKTFQDFCNLNPGSGIVHPSKQTINSKCQTQKQCKKFHVILLEYWKLPFGAVD